MSLIANMQNWIGELPPPVRQALQDRMEVLDLPAGAAVTRAGQQASSIHQVVSGYVKLTGLHEDGRQSFLAIYVPGSCFSETAVVARRAYHHSSTTLTPSRIATLREADFWQLYRAHSEIPETLCRKFARTVSRQIIVHETRSQHRLGKLIAMFFESLAERCADSRTENACVIGIPISQSDIGDHFDVTRQSVQREITVLKSAGILDKQNGRWIVRDLARLRSV